MFNEKLAESDLDYQGHSPKRLTEKQRKGSSIASATLVVITLCALMAPLLIGVRNAIA